MIRREDVADLRPGDVVEVSAGRWTVGTTLRGPLVGADIAALFLGDIPIRHHNGSPNTTDDLYLTVVSRAPRPLYVNHPRTEPVPGDVVRDADNDDRRTWVRNSDGFSYEWLATQAHLYVPREKLPDRLRLLVDGETGQVVP